MRVADWPSSWVMRGGGDEGAGVREAEEFRFGPVVGDGLPGHHWREGRRGQLASGP